MNNKKKTFFSIILEIIIIISGISGVILSILKRDDPFMGGPSTVLFFTIQSNLWMVIVSLIIVINKIRKIRAEDNFLKKWMYILKYVFTISISLTGVVYCFLLVPVMPEGYNPWSLPSVLTHVIVPVCSIIDILLEEYMMRITNKNVVLVLLPPMYYLIFSIVGYIAKFDFGNGQNYPYFFLNFGCDAGLFGFVKEPLEIGCFYWIMLMLIIVLGLGFLYKFIINKLYKEK